MERVIVAFSGGTDSAYLAWAANRVLGEKALAVTANSASLPESHKRDAEAFVKQFGIAHEYIRKRKFDNPDYARNDPNRCFHCKDELFTRLEELGRERGTRHVVTASTCKPLRHVERQGLLHVRRHDLDARNFAMVTHAELPEAQRSDTLLACFHRLHRLNGHRRAVGNARAEARRSRAVPSGQTRKAR